MPAFGKDKVSETDLIKVIAYLKSLKRDTPCGPKRRRRPDRRAHAAAARREID